MIYENGFSDPHDDVSYSSLKKAGILVESPDKNSHLSYFGPISERSSE